MKLLCLVGYATLLSLKQVLSQTCDFGTSLTNSTVDERFINDNINEICFSENTQSCDDNGGVNPSNNMVYECGILSQQTERCGCVESEISATVVFLLDGTMRDELSFNSNRRLWKFWISYWPEWYINDIASLQTNNGVLSNIEYHWIIFGKEVEYVFSYNSGSTNPDWSRNVWPQSLQNSTNKVNFCNAFESAMNIFDNSNKISKILVYHAFNTPKYPGNDGNCDNSQYSSLNFDGIDTYALKWNSNDVNLNEIESKFGNFDQCAVVTDENESFEPASTLEAVPLLSYLQGTVSDFVCGMAHTPTRNPTMNPSFDPSAAPSNNPSSSPSSMPTPSPSKNPTKIPSHNPSMNPTKSPSVHPSVNPSKAPTGEPSPKPTTIPSYIPSQQPSYNPSRDPSRDPSNSPTEEPTYSVTIKFEIPSQSPTMNPVSWWGRKNPTPKPTSKPTSKPTLNPTHYPTWHQPTTYPTKYPTWETTRQPTTIPTNYPTKKPIGHHSWWGRGPP